MIRVRVAPHSVEEKTQENVWDVKSGVVSVQLSIPAMLTQVAKGRLRLEDVARICSERIATVFGLAPRKGRIAVGSDADLTIVDMQKSGTVRAEDLANKTKLTPFAGMRTQGAPVYTIVRGRVVMAEGKIEGDPAGQFVAVERKGL